MALIENKKEEAANGQEEVRKEDGFIKGRLDGKGKKSMEGRIDDGKETEDDVQTGEEVRQPMDQGAMAYAVKMGGIAAAAVLVAVIAALFYRMGKKKGKEGAGQLDDRDADLVQVKTVSKEERGKSQMVGKVHNIGKRQEQQDSFGVSDIQGGKFAVVADGMGGLAEGDKVSQKIVLSMMQEAARLSSEPPGEVPLYRMISHANQEVTRMLGACGQYKSGSTVIAVLVWKNSFQWISVGDSRIYLFCNGRLLQMNREHIYERELLTQAVNQEISFEEIRSERQRKGLTSFVGMGGLKYVDGSMRPVEVRKGDKVLLMSDGVFNTVTEQEICRILSETGDAKQAAEELEKCVLAYQNPKQDNFTAVILDL